MGYLSVNEHSYNLMRLLNAIEYEGISREDFGNVVDWLNMASGVVNVEIVTELYDSSIYVCGSAMDYSKEKSELWSELSKSFVTFNFIWGSMEGVIALITPENDKDSMVYRGLKYLKENYKVSTIQGYVQSYNDLYAMFKTQVSSSELAKLERKSVQAKGLYLVSKLRNQFAHGSRYFPEPDEYNDELNNDIEIIKMSSRIVLFTIQMLLYAKYGEKDFYIENPSMFDFNWELEDPVLLDEMLKKLQFNDYYVRVLKPD
ncbi:hypothetical protein CEW92_08455 [Bacillaceae bacterium SAS-127]|nr:hypothetical protein CEW92_08455 [Bacillaceae bacterium SAS-127]